MRQAVCVACGDSFKPWAKQARYCSHACYAAHLRARAAATLIDRFWAKVNKDGPIIRPELGPCWPWMASTIKGYGEFHLPRTEDGRQHTVYAHRFAWELDHGPIPDNVSVLHKCDWSLCVRTFHHFLGTQSDNLIDAWQKGRLVYGRGATKVDAAGVADIRANYRPKINGKALAAKYGISLVHLVRLANGTGRVVRLVELQPVFEPVPFVHLPVRGEVA